jgi:hypothetical protein
VKRVFAFPSRPGPTVGRRRGAAATVKAIAAALAISGLLPATVFAHDLEPGMSISISGDVHLVSGVYLAVPVSVTCPALSDPYSAIAQDGFGVTVTENVGKELAYGSGAGPGYQSPAYGYGFGTPVACDGSPHDYVINVFPAQGYNGAPNSPPFKKGTKAVVSGDFGIYSYDPSCGINCYDENRVTLGPESIHIK